MANANTSGAVPSGRPGATGASDLDPPPSVPLQIFLFCAFLVTLGAYVIGQRFQPSDKETVARAKNDKLHRLVLEKTKYLSFTKDGFQAEDQKHFDMAVSNFHNAMLVQETGEAHYNLGHALLEQGKTNDAFVQFRAAVGRDPRLRDAYNTWGQALMEQGKAEEAARVYQQAIAQNPNYSLTHFKYALALAATKKNAEALEQFTQAQKLGLDDADFWFHYGATLSQMGQFAQAESYLNKAAAMKADLPNLRFQIALAQQQEGKFAEAAANYEAALAQTPDHPDTLNNLALVYATAPKAELRNPKMAVSLATRACAATGEKNPRFLDTLARSYAADGDFQQAAVWENKALALAKPSGDADLLRELTARYALFQQSKTD